MNSGLPRHLRELARTVAQHEMGHYVVARLLGFRTSDVSLELTGQINGHRGEAAVILGEPIRTLEEAGCYLRRRIQVLYAGALAETLPPRQSPTKGANVEEAIRILTTPGNGAEQDFAKARELIQMLRNIKHPEDAIDDDELQQQLAAINDQLWGSAVNLVQEHDELIVGLAMNLADRVKRINERIVISASELERIPALKELVPTYTRPVA